jgi:CheY-like chemotaxis protein
VDDEEPIRRLLRRGLEGVGYFVEEAASGRDAMRAVEDKFFDLLVLDLSMPEMDGFEVIRAIRRELPHIKIIVSSGFLAGSNMLRMAELLGADATIQKPTSRDDLLKTVCDVLASKRY